MKVNSTAGSAGKIIVSSLPLLLIFVLRIGFWASASRLGIDTAASRSLYPDSTTYIAPAEALIKSGAFLNSSGAAEIIRTPGYPLLIALFMLLFKSGWVSALTLFQTVFNAFACLLLIRTLTNLGVSRKISCLLGAAAVLNPHDGYFALFVLSDSAAQSFFMISLYYLIKALKNERTIDFALVFAFLSVCIFIRPGSLYLPVFLIIGIIAVLVRRGHRQRVVQVAAAFLLFIVVPIGAWQLRNTVAAGYTGFSAISDVNLYFYHSAGINAERNGSDIYAEQEALRNAPAYRQLLKTLPPPAAQRQLALETIRDNIPLYLRLNLQGAVMILLYPGTFDIFRSLPAPETFIRSVREIYLNEGFTLSLVREILGDGFGVITILNILLLFAMTLMTGLAMVRTIRLRTLDPSLAIALIGIFFYSLMISAGPNGFGTYPRFRLTVSFLTPIWIGIGTIKKTPESRLTTEEAPEADPFPPSSAQF